MRQDTSSATYWIILTMKLLAVLLVLALSATILLVLVCSKALYTLLSFSGCVLSHGVYLRMLNCEVRAVRVLGE